MANRRSGQRTVLRIAGFGILALMLGSCRDGIAVDPDTASLTVTPGRIDLEEARDTSLLVSNDGGADLGPIRVGIGDIVGPGGGIATGPTVSASPLLIPTLNAGTAQTVAIAVEIPGGTGPGLYATSFVVLHADTAVATADLTFTVAPPIVGTGVSVSIIAPINPVLRQGDVLTMQAQAFDETGAEIPGAPVAWSIAEPGRGFVTTAGDLVGYTVGDLSLIATYGEVADTLTLSITERGLAGAFAFVGTGTVLSRVTSDLWIHDRAGYTGTWGLRSFGGVTRFGNTLYVWDLSTPASPVRADSVIVDARTVNDVKISADGSLGVITHESSTDLANGVTLLDLSDPLHPTVISRFTGTLETGVHNTWIDGEFLYLVVDGASASSGLRILDISDPANPSIVASFYGGGSFLHDVYVRDGLAFLSHWDAGLIILDVGNGMAGGSPLAPVEVGRVATAGGQTHNAWYWPDGGYVFVGEEDYVSPGVLHVVDVQDLTNPVEVATFRVSGDTPHNFWLDEAGAVLYASWYGNGIRAIDVSGRLLGELDQQGREIAGLLYAQAFGGPFPSVSWAPQLLDGLLYVSDMDNGLWVLQPNF